MSKLRDSSFLLDQLDSFLGVSSWKFLARLILVSSATFDRVDYSLSLWSSSTNGEIPMRPTKLLELVDCFPFLMLRWAFEGV